MKIIRIMGQDARPDIDFHPDSALLLPGRPLFYPDFGGDWMARVYLAVHINRLGKSVSEKFAPRYYDSLSLGLTFEPAVPGCLAPGELSGLDSSITHGEWFAPDLLDSMQPMAVGQEELAGMIMPSLEEINRAVSRISVYTTLRMGDMVLLPLGVSPLPISPRTRLCITGADTEIINLKIV